MSQFFDKISDLYNKTKQKFSNFFENHRQVKEKKNVKNTNKLKKQIVNDEILLKFGISNISIF